MRSESVNSSFTHRRGLLSPVSTNFCFFAMLSCTLPFPFFVLSGCPSQKHALCVLIIPHLVSVAAAFPFTCQPRNSAGSFVLFSL